MDRYFMCPPTYFEVTYRINPWMHPDQPVDPERAHAQWQHLHDELVDLGHRVDLLTPAPGLPDMVYAANGAIVVGDQALIPRFRHAERRGESAFFAAGLVERGISEVRQAERINEGEGDFLLIGERMLAGTGPRSDPAAPAEVAEFFGVDTVRLTLTDPRLYHLDTALAVLDTGTIAYWPEAFDAPSAGVLRELYPDAVIAGERDACSLALNMVSDGSTVLMADDRSALAAAISDRGFTVRAVPTGELLKGGGGAKCCVLQHHHAPG